MFWKRHEGIVLYFQDINIIVSEGNLLFLPTTNLFVAFMTNLIADQNVMSCVGTDLTFHFRQETLAGFVTWNGNLNENINIYTNCS